MTHRDQSNAFNEVVQFLAEHGFDGMAQAMQTLFNEMMKLEQTAALGAAPYERSEARRGQANGFKPKTVTTRLGKLELQVPQTRGIEFYPSALEKGERSAPDRGEAERQLGLLVAKYQTTAPQLAAWLEANIPEGLTVFALPPEHRRRLRTTNPLERLNEELKRRTRVATLFPNEASLLRLVTAILQETSEDWETEKIYLSMETN